MKGGAERHFSDGDHMYPTKLAKRLSSVDSILSPVQMLFKLTFLQLMLPKLTVN